MFILRCFILLSMFFAVSCAQTVSSAERLLSISITEASNKDYGYAFTLAKDAGMQVTGFSLKWDELELAPYAYASDPDWLEIINDFFPAQDIAVSLMIGPIDTNNLRLPADLADKPFDHPEVIERFKHLLDHVFAQIPDLELSSLALGNEIDGYLGTNQQLWKEYTYFFQEVSAYARSKRPGLVVGSKIGFGGLTGNSRALGADVIRASDAVMVTYYPLHNDFSVRNPEVIHENFATLVGLYKHKPIYILEAGYPSSPLLGSSEEKQADFVREIFKAWDTYAEYIKVLDFLWLHDIPETIVEELGVYYRWQDEKFLAYLATLGLRTQQGQDKEAFEVLKIEAEMRGW